MAGRIKVYLCDLVHNYLGAGTYTFPLNIGSIAAYANKSFADKLDIKLFKYPDKLLKALDEDMPHVIGFGNYTWNDDINNKISRLVKKHNNNTMVVCGGPNINCSRSGVSDFFKHHESVDFYLPFQGELPFVGLMGRYLDTGPDIDRLGKMGLDNVYSYDKKRGQPIMGKAMERIKRPDEMPSPYLTGLMDEFFESNLIPIVETSRGCPYRCTFCAQGSASHHKIEFFDLERCKRELRYIADRVKNANLLYLADSNFGIKERDVEIAEYIRELSTRKGYPRRTYTGFAKSQPKIFEIAKILNDTNMVIAMQSLDEEVLKNIKRKSIDVPIFKDIVSKVNEFGGVSGTEIILGLPGETKESHATTIRKLFDWGVAYISAYNGLMLKGSPLALAKASGEYKCKTMYRLVDSSYGRYGDVVSFESEEGILANDRMTELELLSFRSVHWLIMFMWNYKFYYDLLKYLHQHGVNPLDFIIKLIENAGSSRAQDKIKAIFDDFKRDAENEWFDSNYELQKHYSRPEVFESLKMGSHGKLNGRYIFRVILEAREEFDAHVYKTAIEYSEVLRGKAGVIGDIIKYRSQAAIDFNRDWEDIEKERRLTLKYNLPEWESLGYKSDLEETYSPDGYEFSLFMSDSQKSSLEKLLKQYSHHNKNVTLRKMTEYMPINDVFYKARLSRGGKHEA